MSVSVFGSAPGAIWSIRTVPSSHVRMRVSPVTQYLIAAARSLPGEPKLPWPETSGARITQGWLSRTRVS